MTHRLGFLALGTSTLAAALLLDAPVAHADAEFDVSVSGGTVVVVAKGDWHINTDYPWKLTVGDQKLDKAKFTLTETKATVAAPKGDGTLKGGVCSGGQCKMFSTAVTVR